MIGPVAAWLPPSIRRIVRRPFFSLEAEKAREFHLGKVRAFLGLFHFSDCYDFASQNFLSSQLTLAAIAPAVP